MHTYIYDIGPASEDLFNEWEERVRVEMELWDEADQYDWNCEIDTMLGNFNEIK